MTRRQSLFLLLLLAAAASTIRLGFWQLDRLAQMRAQNALIEANLDRPPVPLNDAPPELDPDSEYRPAAGAGTFDYAHTFLLVSRSLHDQPGVHLVTPLRIEGSQWAILVDRGWVSYENRTVEQRTRYQVTGSVEVHGYLRLSARDSWLSTLDSRAAQEAGSYRSVSIERMGPQIPYPILPYYLQQSEPIDGGGLQPEPNPQIDLSEGPHLGYAIQWFAFAAIAITGGGYWLFRNVLSSGARESP